MDKNKLIDRYVYDVTRRVESKSREEIEKELKSNIYDMLGDNPSDDEIKQVLLSLGKPSDLANKYRSNDNSYLISPKYYHDYIKTLKIAGIIVLTFTLVFSILTFAFSINTLGFEAAIDKFADGLGENLLNAAISVFAVITFVFFVIERYQINISKYNKPFSLDDLPELPKHEKLAVNLIARLIAIIFSTTFTIIFIYIILNHDKYLGWYHKDGDVLVFTQAFNNTIKYFIIPIIITFAVDLANNIYMMTKGIKTKLSTFIDMINSVLQVLLLQVILTTKAIINNDFFNQMSLIFNKDLNTIMDIYNKAVISIQVTLLFVCLIVVTTHLIEIFKVKKLSKI